MKTLALVVLLLTVMLSAAWASTNSWRWDYGNVAVKRMVDVDYGVVCYIATTDSTTVTVPSMQCIPFQPPTLTK